MVLEVRPVRGSSQAGLKRKHLKKEERQVCGGNELGVLKKGSKRRAALGDEIRDKLRRVQQHPDI